MWCSKVDFRIVKGEVVKVNECYIEQLVKQKATTPSIIMKLTCISMVLITIFFWLVTELPFLFALIIIVLAFLLFKRSNLEYEYQFYNGELDIDQIAGEQKRKRVFSLKLREIDVMAQTGTGILKEYQNLKKYDCTSNQGNTTYTIIFDYCGNKIQLLIEPNEELLLNMKYYEPRKIFIM